MRTIYIITLLCTDTDGRYYNSIITKAFNTFESAMDCVNDCIRNEKKCFDENEKIIIKEKQNGKELWGYGICLTDYEIKGIKIDE